MIRTFISPSKYVQGAGALETLGDIMKSYGQGALLVASKRTQSSVRKYLDLAIEKTGCHFVSGEFGGECSKKEIERLRKLLVGKACDVVIGIGGGKALDTAKAVAYYENRKMMIIPTIASTDAPCSSLAVVYTENGEFEEYVFLDRNPDMVLVDTEIIAKAPSRFMVAGMGDALATYFEARTCAKTYANNISCGKTTKAALAIAKLCYQTLLEDSVKAKAACDSNVVTHALENIVEANILLSGLGFESSGLAAAHAIHNGLTVLKATHTCYHGEKVAFGVIVQLVLENAEYGELVEVLHYCKSVGLPTCLKELGVLNPSRDEIMNVAAVSCAKGETIHNLPYEITPEDVFGAILTADVLGSNVS